MNEDVFIRALTERDETARLMSRVLKPKWLENAELQPVLSVIYEFVSKHDIAPSLDTVRRLLEERDPLIYKNRLSPVIDRLEKIPADNSLFIHTAEQARDIAITRSCQQLFKSPEMCELQESNDGGAQIELIHQWIRQFSEAGDLVEGDLREAFNMLVQTSGSGDEDDLARIKSGVEFIDEWAGNGGLRKKQLAIIIAPTGQGKSALLAIIAHNVAKQLERNVLFITNELSVEDTAARLVAKITGRHLSAVYQDPLSCSAQLERYWKQGLHKHFRLAEVIGEVDADYIDALIGKYSNVYGWKPDVVIVDYMERMKPIANMSRDREWSWIGHIAKDLLRMAKRRGVLVWTAGQTNRDGMNMKSAANIRHAQGSIRHIQEAALLLIVRKMKAYPGLAEDETLMHISCEKSRFGVSGESRYVVAKLGKMTLREDDQRSPASVERWLNRGKSDEDEEG